MVDFDTDGAVKEKSKISIVAKFFAIYIFFTWVQTSQQNMGTIIAILTILFVILSAFFSGQASLHQFRLSARAISIIVILILVIFSTMITGSIQSQLKIIAQFILFLVVSNIYFNTEEISLIKKVFVLSSTILAILVILGCTIWGAGRYFHGNVIILGTAINPNFLGIPTVAASVLLFYSFLYEKKRALTFILLFINVFAVFCTASKGNSLSLVATIALITLYWVSNRNVSLYRKLAFCIVLVLCFFMFVSFLQQNLPEQWERMTNISAADDNGRLELWSYAYNGFAEHPLLGHGVGSMKMNYGKVTHNTYLQMFYELGLVGGISFLFFSFSLLLKSFKLKNKGVFFVLLAIFVKLFFMSALDDRTVWGLFCWAEIVSNSFYISTPAAFRDIDKK